MTGSVKDWPVDVMAERKLEIKKQAM